MALDGLTLGALGRELTGVLLGSRVQKVVQVDPLTVALESYGQHRRSWLVLSAEPQQPKVYLASARPGRGVETPTPLLLLLRKHVEGLVFTSITQPPGDRILIFSLAGTNHSPVDASEPVRPAPRPGFQLIIEAISQYSNLILVDDHGIVVDALRRVTADQNRQRVTLPRHPYRPPPAQTKQILSDASASVCAQTLARAAPSSTIWQLLVTTFAGLGPVSAREIVFRTTGDVKAGVPGDARSRDVLADRLATTIQSVVLPILGGNLTPSVGFASPATSEAPDAEIVDFAPFALTHLGRWEARPTLSAAAEEFYHQTRGIRSLDIARRVARAVIAAERVLAEKKRDSLARALEGTAKSEEWRRQGELLLAYSGRIPRGAASFQAEGVDLELDPRLSAVEYAQQFFRRYRKAKAALREVPALLDEAEARLRYLDDVAAMAEIADSGDALRAIRLDLRARRERSDRPTKARRPGRLGDGILRLHTSTNRELLVGRTALQNNAVTFDLARPEDIWLHARGCPGAHVILRAGDSRPTPEDLVEAAQVAAYYSTNRGATKVTVDWTSRKNVRRIAKATPGLVTYTGESSLAVSPVSRPGAAS